MLYLTLPVRWTIFWARQIPFSRMEFWLLLRVSHGGWWGDPGVPSPSPCLQSQGFLQELPFGSALWGRGSPIPGSFSTFSWNKQCYNICVESMSKSRCFQKSRSTHVILQGCWQAPPCRHSPTQSRGAASSSPHYQHCLDSFQCFPSLMDQRLQLLSFGISVTTFSLLKNASFRQLAKRQKGLS